MFSRILFFVAFAAMEAVCHGDQNTVLEAQLRQYLGHTYPERITHVEVGRDEIRIEGMAAAGGCELWLAEIPMNANFNDAGAFEFATRISPAADEIFSTTVKRFAPAGGHTRDRLLSRWAIVRRTDGGGELLSHAHYADSVQPSADLPEEKPAGKKGIGGLWLGRPMEDLDALGLSAATVNIAIGSFMRLAPGPDRIAFEYGGRTWYAEAREVEQLDRVLLEASKRRLLVSAIILVPRPFGPSPDPAYARLVAHPDADPAGIFAMPNVVFEDGLRAYGAALDFLARRYSEPGGQYGRIHYWIMHNEVNSGWTWTNAGDKPDAVFVDLYVKSLRAASLIARQYNAHAKVFVSLDHHWTARAGPHCCQGRNLLELLCDFCAAEGDFEWGLAHHPYPRDLFEPRVWRDSETIFSFDTPKITFRNLEVLAAWMSLPRALYLGKTRRPIHLTEQGFNSRDYSEESLRDQAAGMAYAWNKVKRIPAIELLHYHNWVDNRAEYGLKIGLRKFPDEASDPMGRKPIWFVYQALGTPAEEGATEFAKPLIGIKDWGEIMHTGAIR